MIPKFVDPFKESNKLKFMKSIYKIGFSLTTLLSLVLCTSPISAIGNPPWSYDFDNPTSLEDWWTSHGNVTIENGYVQATDCVVLLESCSISMWKNATETIGEWNFDFYNNSTAVAYGLYFYFMGNEVVESDDIDNGLHPRYAYGLHVGKDGSMSLFYQPDANTEWPIWFDAYTNTENPDGWYNYRITRNSTGFMQVYRNDSLKLEANDNNLTSSEYVNFIMERYSKMDLINYRDYNYVPDPPILNCTYTTVTAFSCPPSPIPKVDPGPSTPNNRSLPAHIWFESIVAVMIMEVIRKTKVRSL